MPASTYSMSIVGQVEPVILPKVFGSSHAASPLTPRVMSTVDARIQKRHGGFWGNQTFNLAVANARLWVGS
jgi:hypothetical protein